MLRISYSQKQNKNGVLLYTAKIQLRILFGLWVTVYKVTDMDKWYTETHVQEVMAYLNNEEHRFDREEGIA